VSANDAIEVPHIGDKRVELFHVFIPRDLAKLNLYLWRRFRAISLISLASLEQRRNFTFVIFCSWLGCGGITTRI
jgi:hypothetical protein